MQIEVKEEDKGGIKVIKFSGIKDDEIIVVISEGEEGDEVTEASSIRENKELYKNKKMHIAERYRPKLDVETVIEFIEEYIQCNDMEVTEEWEIECSEKNKNDLKNIVDKILNESSLSFVYGEKIENDL